VTNLQIKLVDFGGDGFTPGTNDSEGIVQLGLTQGGWQTLEIPISDFLANGLINMTELSQIILESTVAGVKLYLDNLYFIKPSVPPTVPTVAAPTPTKPAADVVSLFSNAYADVPVGEWSTGWDTADVADILVAGDDVKEYTFTDAITGLGFAGINFDGTNALDGTGFTHMRLDVWTPDVTSLRIKLVDFGGDGFTPGTNDSEGIVDRTLTQGVWQTLEFPISDFQATGLAGVTELSQIILESTVAGVKLYLDNLYFVAP
jgi:hypothetical protein